MTPSQTIRRLEEARCDRRSSKRQVLGNPTMLLTTRLLEGKGRKPVLTASKLAFIRRLRDEIRKGEGGGGMCHWVTDVLSDKWGWGRASGAVADPETGDVWISTHVWNVLEDGTIVDPTYDQLGQGEDVAVIPPDDPRHAFYRMEWFEDYHPGMPEWEPEGDWARHWTGELDVDRQNRLTKDRGEGWYVRDQAQYQAYLDADRRFSVGEAKASSDAEYFAQATRHAPMPLLKMGELGADMMSGGAKTVTRKSDSGNLIVRWKENGEAVFLLGMVTKSDRLERGDLADLREWIDQLIGKLREGKALLTSPNEKSRPFLRRVIGRLEQEGYSPEVMDVGGNVMIRV